MNFCGDYRESFCFEVNLKLVFVISFKIKQFQNLSLELFNDDFLFTSRGQGLLVLVWV